MIGEPPSANASLRIGIPDLFAEGKFEQVLILTYGADLEFYERVLRRHFGWFRNQIVLGDGRLLADTITTYKTNGALRHLNRSWIAAPVEARHAVHAKAILLAGRDDGLLLVGSGNLNMAGYARNGECFTPYRWTDDRPDDLPAFTTLRELTDRFCDHNLVDPIAADRLRIFWAAYDWWNEPPAPTGPVRHNFDTPLGTQLLEAVSGEEVTELTVVAPFHDPNCAALQRLITALQPKTVRVLVQAGHCSVNPDQLSRVLATHNGTTHAISANGDDAAYLHAKIIHVRTPTRDVCLTGSANCSMVALWTPQPAANVEIGNLAVGGHGTFDGLFDPSVLTISPPADPASLNLSINDDSDPDTTTAAPTLKIRCLTWSPPELSFEVSTFVAHSDEVALSIDGRPIPAGITISPGVDDWTPIRAHPTDAVDVAAINDVAVVTVQIAGAGEVSSVPYQPDRLQEQDRRRIDVDRLRQAAGFEIDDPDLHHALAALEGILVGDSVATWAKARTDTEGVADEDGSSIAWKDIDWAAIRRSARHVAYGELGTAGSDLAAYLEALSRATRDLIDPQPLDTTAGAVREVVDEDESDDEPDVAIGLEGADADEVEDTPETDRRQSAAGRNRRLLRNFIRRNLKVLAQPGFRDGAGSGVVVLNIIILNWLCWWVATSDEERQGDFIDERLQLWDLMWGDGSAHSGYFESLPADFQALVIERFDDQRFESVTIASIVDVWSHITRRTDPEYKRLRRGLRAAVTQSCWQVTARHVTEATKLTNARPTAEVARDPGGLVDVLWEILCEPIDEEDARSSLSAALCVDATDVDFTDQPVIVEPGVQRSVREARCSLQSVDVELAISAFAAWLGIEELPYYRLRWNGGVALYRTEAGTGWVYSEETDEMIELSAVRPERSAWTEWAGHLLTAVERSAEEAA